MVLPSLQKFNHSGVSAMNGNSLLETRIQHFYYILISSEQLLKLVENFFWICSFLGGREFDPRTQLTLEVLHNYFIKTFWGWFAGSSSNLWLQGIKTHRLCIGNMLHVHNYIDEKRAFYSWGTRRQTRFEFVYTSMVSLNMFLLVNTHVI